MASVQKTLHELGNGVFAMSVDEAARDISLAEFDHWMDAERLYANLCVLYRDFRGDTEIDDILEVMAGIARLEKEHRQAPATP